MMKKVLAAASVILTMVIFTACSFEYVEPHPLSFDGNYTGVALTTGECLPEYLDNLQVILISRKDVGWRPDYVFDFDKGHIYNPEDTSAVKDEDILCDIDDEMKEEIKNILNEADVCGWGEQTKKSKSSGDATKLPDTTITIITKDGDVYQRSFVSTDSSDKAKSFYDCAQKLQALSEKDVEQE